MTAALAELKQAQTVDQGSALPLYYRGDVLRRVAEEEATVKETREVAGGACGEGRGNGKQPSPSPLSEPGPVAFERVGESALSNEAAACFLEAARAIAQKLPEAADECIDAALRAKLFPEQPLDTRAAHPGRNRRGSISSKGVGSRGGSADRPSSTRPVSAASSFSSCSEEADDASMPAAPPPLLSAVLAHIPRREEALAAVGEAHAHQECSPIILRLIGMINTLGHLPILHLLADGECVLREHRDARAPGGPPVVDSDDG